MIFQNVYISPRHGRVGAFFCEKRLKKRPVFVERRIDLPARTWYPKTDRNDQKLSAESC